MLAHQLEFADPVIREKQYYAVTDVSGEVVGFAQLFPMVGLTRIGLGMRPELCGQRSGQSFVSAIIQEAQQRVSIKSNELDLEVLTWNDRAIRVYQQAGFQITDTYMRPTPTGLAEVHCMVYVPINETDSNPTLKKIP
jgi:RimJ/RimL family protein N-acetyltransferase